MQGPLPGYKPHGLWYEVNGDWRRWLQGEELEWHKDAFLYRLTLGDERMLRLRGAKALDDFTKEYGTYESTQPSTGRPSFDYIEWARVAERYDGIEIAPYVWPRRLELMWYYGWDCASGCIWRPRGAVLEEVGRL